MNPIFKAAFVLVVVGLAASVIIYVGDPLNTDPTPGDIPGYHEVVPSGFSAPTTKRVVDIRDADSLMQPRLGVVRIADAIILQACPEKHPTCAAQALYIWSRNAITHQDALLARSHLLSPEETILYREADDQTLSILLASLLRAEGIDARIGDTAYVTFVEANVSGEVVRLDPACVNCRFGETRYRGSEEAIVWVG